MKSKSSFGARRNPLHACLTQEGFSRLERGHPWLRASDLCSDWRIPLDTLAVHVGEHWFLYDVNSAIRLRRLGPAKRHWLNPSENIEPEFLVTPKSTEEHFAEALENILACLLEEKSLRVGRDSSFRWCFADADSLPGLVLDIFGENVVAERTHPFWEKNWSWVAKIIEKVSKRPLLLSPPEKWIQWNRLEWKIGSKNNHKTGMYLDQRDNHHMTCSWAKSLQLKTAWDLFSYVGGFSLHLAKTGLTVTAVDASQDALETLNENAERNECRELISTERADAFEWMEKQREQGARCDLIVLDPPSLAPKEKDVEAAAKALRRLMANALQCLNPGGLLVVCVCSHHISKEKLVSTLRKSAHDARVSVHELTPLSQSSDHAPLVSLPESHYLRGGVFQAH